MAQASEPIEPSKHHGENGERNRLARTRRVLRETEHGSLGESVLDLGLVAGIDATADRVSVTLLDTGESLDGMHRLWTRVRDALADALPEIPRIEVWIDWDAGWSVEQASPRIRSARGWTGPDNGSA